MRVLQLFASSILVLHSTWGWAAVATCDVEYSGKVTSIDLMPVSDPYEMKNLDLGGDFRFSAQYLIDSKKLKTYVYHRSKERYVLIHAAEYRIPDDSCVQGEKSLGLNKVYSAKMEREFSFQCSVICR